MQIAFSWLGSGLSVTGRWQMDLGPLGAVVAER
jgi:hypothetical protein